LAAIIPILLLLPIIFSLQSHFEIADDTDAVTAQLILLMTDIPIGDKQVHDANIVATMLAYGIPTLLTHNAKVFERFTDRIAVEAMRPFPCS